MVENSADNVTDSDCQKYRQQKADFVESVVRNGIQHYIRNGTGTALSCQLNEEPILLIQDHSLQLDSCYLTSVIAQYLGYPMAELNVTNESSLKKFVMKAVLWLGGVFFKWTGVHKVVYVDHNLCSTPTYSNNVQKNSVELLAKVRERFPGYAVVFRGLNDRSNSQMMAALSYEGVKRVLCRRLYYLETAQPATYEKKRPLVQDQKRWKKLREKEGLAWHNLVPADTHIALDYYKQIYLEKYARQNPDYLPAFIELSQRTEQLKWEVLKKDEDVLAVQGYAWNEVDLNTPFIGYHQELARELRLYPSLNVQLLNTAKELGRRLNMSSGAAEFKRQRGGEPVFEYQFIDVKNQPTITRWMWQFLSWYSEKVVGPYIVKHHL